MWRIVPVIFVAILWAGTAIANTVTAAAKVAEGIAVVNGAKEFAELAEGLIDSVDGTVISVFNAVDLATHYQGTFTSNDFSNGTGLLFDVTVFNSSNSTNRYVMVPLLVGSGSNAEDAALRSLLGSRVVKHETFGADLAFLKDHDKIASLPGDLTVSDKSRAIWVFKDADGSFSFHVVDDGKTFWANARSKRIKLILQKSVIKSLPLAEAVAAKAERYDELSELYREQIRNEGISGQLASLHAAREKAASEFVDAMHKLDQAQGIMRSLKGIQVIQDIISVAAIVNNAAQSAANQSQLDQIQSDLASMKGEMSQINASIDNFEARINFLSTAVQNLSGQLNGIETSINQLFIEKLKLNSDTVPEAQPVLP